MAQIIIGGIIAFFSTFYAIPVIIRVANEKKLYDEPDDIRKLHLKPIPSLGGLGMFIGFTLCLLLTVKFSAMPELQYYMAAFLVIFFIGIKDDVVGLSALKKFLGQLIVAAILMFGSHLLISDMHGFLGMHVIDPAFSYLLTLFTIIVIINAFNLIDGVDGLAGSIGLISCLVFGSFFLVNGDIPYAIIGFGFAATIIAFLIYNFHPAKIFMGDTGSLLMGLVNSILVIKFIESGAGYAAHPVAASPAIGFAILLLPLMDTLRVFSIRIIHGRSPFSPDRNHIHHLLLDRGFSAVKVTLTCAGISLIFAAAGFMLRNMSCTWLIVSLAICFFTGIYALYITRTKVNMRVVKGEGGAILPPDNEKRVRLISLFSKTAASVEED